MIGRAMLAQMDAYTKCHHVSETSTGNVLCAADAQTMVYKPGEHPAEFAMACDAHLADLTFDGCVVEKMVPVTRPPAAAPPAL